MSDHKIVILSFQKCGGIASCSYLALHERVTSLLLYERFLIEGQTFQGGKEEVRIGLEKGGEGGWWRVGDDVRHNAGCLLQEGHFFSGQKVLIQRFECFVSLVESGGYNFFLTFLSFSLLALL